MKSIFFACLFIVGFHCAAQQPLPAWEKQTTVPYPGKQDDICFVDEHHGWYCNGQGKIYRTENGGADWKLVFEQKGTFFRCIAFIDTLHGFAGNVGTDYFPNVSDTIPAYRTDDGGKSWQPITYKGPYVKGLCAIDIVKEQIINQGNIDYRYHVYGVGRVGTPANIMVSHDGGKTFESRSMEKYCKMLFDIKMFNKNEGFACAASSDDMEKAHAVIIYTKDGGKNWQKKYESKRPFETSWKIAFPTRKVGYATIQSYNPDSTINQQRIAKTTDGGMTWKELNLCLDAKAREFGVGFVNEKVGYVGTTATGYSTTDGGLHWSKMEFGRAVNKIRVYDLGDSYNLYSIGVNVHHVNIKKTAGKK